MTEAERVPVEVPEDGRVRFIMEHAADSVADDLLDLACAAFYDGWTSDGLDETDADTCKRDMRAVVSSVAARVRVQAASAIRQTAVEQAAAFGPEAEPYFKGRLDGLEDAARVAASPNDSAAHDARVRAEQQRQAQADALRAAVADVESQYPTLRQADPLSDWGQGVAWMLDRLTRIANRLAAGSAVPVATPDTVQASAAGLEPEPVGSSLLEPMATPTEPTVTERAGCYVVTFPTGDTSTWDMRHSYLFNPGTVWQHRHNADALEAIINYRGRTAPAEQDGQR